MLKTIVEFLKGFVDIVGSLVDFVIGIVEDIVYVVKLCGSFVLKIPTLFGWLPNAVVSIIVIIFGIVVVYKILGREG